MFYKKENTVISYAVFGSGKKTILILPGWGDTACTFQEIISFLQKDYTIYILDYPGFGESPVLCKVWTIYDYVTFLASFLKDLSITPTLVIGHSFGGRLAILLSGYLNLSFPKILLMDSAGIKPRKTLSSLFKKYSYKFLKGLKWILPQKKKDAYLSFLFSKFASSDYYNLPSSMRLTFQNIIHEDLKRYLPKMDSEVLLLWGKEDQDTPLRDAYIMHRKIKDSELIVLERCGHFCYLENPYLTLKIILAFLEEDIS